ncbi:hypothetical protein PSHT_04210 [Puccinia striiformis]|uniref:Uncharacterized protein n=1 Tax=Puccinia striiformis TaxID=27350 RepID=A0A2S4WDM6_9BASI|nr:hypothetical protein PSHT_04210 [Puccinia striiformis]
MISTFYAACFLAACMSPKCLHCVFKLQLTIFFAFRSVAAATPIEHQARQISSFNQASGSGQQATSNSQVTPWGMSSNQQSSSYSYQTSSQVMQGFTPVLSLLGNMQGMLAQGTMTQAIAMSSMNQLVGQLQPVMGSLIGCGCIGGGGIGSMFNNNSAFTSYAQTLNPLVNLVGGAVPGFGGLLPGF